MISRRALLGLVRIAVGAAVLWFVVLRDPGDVFDQIGRVSLPLFATAAILQTLVIAVGVTRWRAYLDALEVAPGFGSLARLHLAGAFLNMFLPTGVGGDAYKSVRLARAGYAEAGSVASVLLDRLAGLVGLAVVGSVAGLWALSDGAPLRVWLPALVVCALVFGGEMFLVYLGRHLGRRWTKAGLRGRIGLAAAEIHAGGRHPAAMARGYALGVVMQVSIAVVHVILAHALGLRVSIAVIVCAATLAQVAALVPVTINGLGFRESTYVVVLGAVAVSGDAARAFAVLNLGTLVVASLLCGALAVALGGHVRAPVTSRAGDGSDLY